MSDFEVTGLNELAADLERAGRDIERKARDVVERNATQLRNQWHDNARATARRHGRHYPKSITAEQIPDSDAITWEVGPDSAMKQGSMGRGFEFGSVNQPPHLDGMRAFTQQEPKFLADIEQLTKEIL